jgi:small subunit ribosomal protein S6
MTAPADAVIELDRQLKLSEAVMRTKVLRAEDVQFSITPVEFASEKPAKKAPAKKAESKSETKSEAKSEAKAETPVDSVEAEPVEVAAN